MIKLNEAHQSKRPNVIWILADQMRAQAMSHRGDPNVSTPNLDRMAIEGVNFTHAISGTPLCSPFRGSMLTGKYPHRSTVPALHSPMSTKAYTVAHSFREHGYRTAYIGKWHVDGNRPELDMNLPENRASLRHIPPERRGGFEDWWTYENNNQPFHCYVQTDGPSGEPVSMRLPGYETDALTDLLIDWMKNRTEQAPNQPFFGVLSVQPPHDPYVAPAEDMARHKPGAIQVPANVPPIPSLRSRVQVELAGYYAAIERIDANVGRIRDELRRLGIDQETYVIFFSDHGDMHGAHGQFRKMAPWEESIRIPFLVAGPTRKSYKNQECRALLNHVDIAPTTLGLCGISPPASMDGFDYSRWIVDRFAPADELPESAYLSLPVPTALSEPLVEEGIDRPFRGIVTRDGWKYVAFENQPWLMYNLNEDPLEMMNLVYDFKYWGKRKELHERLLGWIEKTGDEFALPLSPSLPRWQQSMVGNLRR
ncbi:sulfatase [Ammoniphilus sp. YIM 78166]|uniref:sulfatase family protein n=1 Tax=Ammoniphilus sp. YIM 78166 TaxID=1644106 RepID=UPI0010700560|nr:sulfatase [Ammoniphilus sp. YIM 78166]